MVYRHGLGPCVERHGSSSLPSGTKVIVWVGVDVLSLADSATEASRLAFQAEIDKINYLFRLEGDF